MIHRFVARSEGPEIAIHITLPEHPQSICSCSHHAR